MLADFWGHASIPEAAKWIEAEKRKGRLIEVTLEGAPGKRGFAAVARPAHRGRARHPCPHPRHGCACSRPSIPSCATARGCERIFGFDYRIEVFVPAPKRKYGYYVFPLLEGGRFVGRIDMKADRAKDRLAVKALWLEPRLALSRARRTKLDAELARQARLAGVRDIVFPASALKTG